MPIASVPPGHRRTLFRLPGAISANFLARSTPRGSRYQECYDVLTGKPGVAYLRLYDELKDELSRMGMVFA